MYNNRFNATKVAATIKNIWFKRTDSKIFVARTAIISVRNMFCLLVDRFLVMWLTEF